MKLAFYVMLVIKIVVMKDMMFPLSCTSKEDVVIVVIPKLGIPQLSVIYME